MIIVKTEAEKKAIHFRHMNVDYSEFDDGFMCGAHIARFIRQHVLQGIPLKLSTHPTSGVHALDIVSTNQSIMFFTDDTAHFQVNDIFYRHQCVVDLPNYTTFLYYAKALIKNITFCYYLINEDPTYSRIDDKIDNDEFIFKKLVANSIDNEYGISLNYTDSHFHIDFMNYNCRVTLNISRKNELLNFSLSTFDPVTNKKETKASYNFNEFIFKVNKSIYHDMVESRLNISAKEFTIQHREIVKMFDI